MSKCRCSCSGEAAAKEPLIPSLLYTQGDEKVQAEAEEDLKVPDPSPLAASEAIAMAIWEGEGGNLSK